MGLKQHRTVRKNPAFPGKPDVAVSTETKGEVRTKERRIMKKRERQRANRKVKEQMLSLKDTCGVCDPTPYEAVRELINEFKRNKRRYRHGICTDVN